MHNQYPSDKSLSSIYDLPTPTPTGAAVPSPPSASASAPLTTDDMENLMRSPTGILPNSPAPAYTALPNKNVDFHFTPILNGKVGDIELETIDGKRFLVHKKVLEQETVFFHIYYGFVPVWRLNAASSSASAGTNPLPADITVPIHQSSIPPAPPPSGPTTQINRISTSVQGFNNLRCLPKIIANTLSRNSISLASSIQSNGNNRLNEDVPPPLPPKDVVTAPTPTSSPYTWIVPETSHVLMAFLSLIYPKGVITRNTEDLLDNLEITSRVIRASLGYQSSKALSISRDRLSQWVESNPIEVYSLACFFKFGDLVKLSSRHAMRVPRDLWPNDSRVLMGRSGCSNLLNLQLTRLNGLKGILEKPLYITDADLQQYHGHDGQGKIKCGDRLEEIWGMITTTLISNLKPDMDLFELLEIDLRELGIGHCENCLVVLGKNVQRCLMEARELPRSL